MARMKTEPEVPTACYISYPYRQYFSQTARLESSHLYCLVHLQGPLSHTVLLGLSIPIVGKVLTVCARDRGLTLDV